MKKKIVIDLLLLILLILEFSRAFMKPIYHEVIGVILVILVIMHFVLHREYFKGFTKNRILMLIMNILLFLSFMVTVLLGILSSQELFQSINLNNVTIIKLHKVFAYILLILVGLHIGVNCKVRIIKSKIIIWLMQVIIVLYGAYSFIKLDVMKHILGIYGFFVVDNNIWLHMLRYLAIILMFSVISYYFGKLLFRKKKVRQVIVQDKIPESKSLVLYFSRADENYAVGFIKQGNTEVIANYIKEITHADIFKVERLIPYPVRYQPCLNEAKAEQQNGERPELLEELTDIHQYDIIYIGSPIYWNLLPQPMITQLEKLNWFRKEIRIFTTHEGSELGAVPEQIESLCKGAIILENGLAIRGSKVSDAKKKVEDWIASQNQLSHIKRKFKKRK